MLLNFILNPDMTSLKKKKTLMKEREGSNLCDGCKHFLQHCIGLSSSSNTCLNVETSSTGTGNKSVSEVKMWEIESYSLLIKLHNQFYISFNQLD